MLELSLTRIFSVVFYYHFAFLEISIALFGLGVGGVLSYLIQAKGKSVYNRLGVLAGAVSLVTVASLVIVLTRSEQTNLTLAIIYFTSAMPFMFAGIIVSTAISESIDRVHRVYFWDLIGAATGCMLLVPFLDFFGGPTTVIVVAVLFAVSSAIWFNIAGNTAGRIAGVALALLLVALVVANLKMRVIDVRFAKGQELAKESFVKWNSFSRIAIADRGHGMQEILIDADASTGIANFDFKNLTERDRQDLAAQGPGYVYQVRPGGRTLIIGPGGGWDVARAIASGSKDITGVEINPIIAETIMQRNFAHLSRNLYARPEVKIVVEDGRSFVRRTPEKYQIIQATLVDTWASTAAGAFALSENNLYTTEAFYDYLSHLTEDGILAFTRWGFEPPRESLRLLALARVALDRLGEHEYHLHAIVVREGGAKELAGWGARDTVLIARKPLSETDLRRAKEAAAAGGMTLVYIPGGNMNNEFARLLTTDDPESFYEHYRYDVSPVDDNRPFFFYTVQPRDLIAFLKGPDGSADYKINRAVPLLLELVAVSILSTLIVLLLPPLLLSTRLPAEPGVRRFLLYFVCLGVGYILIQVALIQKFVLLLGHPTYALTVIVFSMLVASGVGSSLSRRILREDPQRLLYVLTTVAVLVAILAFAAPIVSRTAASWPLWVRCVITAFLIAPPAFFMGVPFPAGLQRLKSWHPPSVRWAWALNAASSVLGSAMAIFLAIYLGLRETLLVGGTLYIAAALLMKAHKTKASEPR
jgi:hypothetical protein